MDMSWRYTVRIVIMGIAAEEVGRSGHPEGPSPVMIGGCAAACQSAEPAALARAAREFVVDG
jgi:hypothetical protein